MTQTQAKLSNPKEYFDFIEALFQDSALSGTSAILRNFRIGERNIRLQFAGEALLSKICPALEHLANPEVAAPDLEIGLWDSASTGVAMPSPPWELDQIGAKGEIAAFIDEEIFTSFQRGPDVFSIYHRGRRRGFFWVRDAGRIPIYESGSPLRYLLHLFFKNEGRHFVHGAALGTAAGAALLTGKGGMGKSTTAAAGLFSRLSYLGDDYVLMSGGPRPLVYSLYNSVKFSENSLGLLPKLGSHVSNPAKKPDEKFIVFLSSAFPEKLLTQAPLRAILIPQIDLSEKPFLEPVSAVEALKAMAPSTLIQLPQANPELFFQLSGLVKNLPSFRLHLGSDPRRAADAVAEFLEGL